MVSKDAAASAISLTTNQGAAETIVVTNTQGTDNAAITLAATAGGVSISAGANVNVTSDLTILSGDLRVDGGDMTAGTVGNAMNVFATTTGTVTVGGGPVNLSAAGSTTAVDGALTVGENTTLTGNLTVNGNVTLGDATTDTLSFFGVGAVQQQATVGVVSNANQLTTDEAATINGLRTALINLGLIAS